MKNFEDLYNEISNNEELNNAWQEARAEQQKINKVVGYIFYKSVNAKQCCFSSAYTHPFYNNVKIFSRSQLFIYNVKIFIVIRGKSLHIKITDISICRYR